MERKVDVRLPGKGDPNSHGARPVRTECRKSPPRDDVGAIVPKVVWEGVSGDTTPCRMTGVALHSHVRYKEM